MMGKLWPKGERDSGILGERLAVSDRDLLFIAADSMPIGLVMFDSSKRLIVANKKFQQLYDVSPKFAERGTHLRDLLGHRFSRDCNDAAEREKRIEAIVRFVEQGVPNRRIDTLNDGRRISIMHQPLSEGGWVGTHEDITELYLAKERLQYLAYHDNLTGLKNRTAFWEDLDRAMECLEHGTIEFAVHMIDLDHFKDVNDRYGHDAGDVVLLEVANRLRLCARKGDVIARLGGDEFAIIQMSPGLGKMEVQSLADRVIGEVTQEIRIGRTQVRVGASIGIAMAGDNLPEKSMLVKFADTALYCAKAAGRNCARLYSPEVICAAARAT